MTDKTPVTSPSAPAAGPYSPGLSAGEWVFLAGQTGTGETIEDQTESTLGKVTALLGAAGCAPADVVCPAWSTSPTYPTSNASTRCTSATSPSHGQCGPPLARSSSMARR